MPAVRSRDTSIEAERVQRDVIRRMSGAERVRIAVEMSEAARELSLAGIRARNPVWSEARSRRALLELLYGSELVERAWGPATDS
jgi:hypothetical protein